MARKKFMREVFTDASSNTLSSKRVFGSTVLVVILVCTLYLTFTEGGTQVVENILQTGYIIAASLLGVSSITGIWKNKPPYHKDDTEDKDKK